MRPFCVSPFQGRSSTESLFLPLSPQGDGWCDVLGFVPASGVSSSSTLQIFRDTIKPCPPVNNCSVISLDSFHRCLKKLNKTKTF